jgi:hypothetical protein
VREREKGRQREREREGNAEQSENSRFPEAGLCSPWEEGFPVR